MGTDPERYLQLIAPREIESEQARRDMARMSGCALVVRGIWREIGIRHEVLERPYRIGRAVADLARIAADLGALRDARGRWAELVPQPGDALIVGSGPHLHAWTVVEPIVEGWPGPFDSLIRGLDGGQRDDDGLQVIRTVRHDVSGIPPYDEVGRPVRWLIDLDALHSVAGQ